MERPIPPLGDIDAALQGRDERIVRRPVGPGAHPRKPWLAFLLGLFVPSLAFAYVGRLGVFVLLYGGFLAGLAVLGWSGLVQTLAGIGVVMLGGAALFLASLVLPWRWAVAQRPYRLRAYNRGYVYVLLLVAVQFPLSLGLLQRGAWLGFDTYRVPAASMAPSVDAGDFIVADTRASTLASLRIGDVVVVESVRRPGELIVRRIVATGGQHVVVGADGVSVDGVVQPRTHVQGSDALPPDAMKYADTVLAPDELYLMGDNRPLSVDSRTTGPATRASIHGKATTIWWSLDGARLGPIPAP